MWSMATRSPPTINAFGCHRRSGEAGVERWVALIHVIDKRRDAGGAESIVDVDYRHIG